MYCHDSKVIYYVIAGDRVFCCSLASVLAGHAQAVKEGETNGIGPAGRSPFASDTAVVGLAEMLVDEHGEQRSLAPLALDSRTGFDLLAGVLRVPVGRLGQFMVPMAEDIVAAISVWSDFCDEVSGHMDDGAEQEDAFAMAGIVPLARAA